MIFYLVTAESRNTMEQYVSAWGPAPGSRMRFLLYDDLPRLQTLDPGTYIFSDLERLSAPSIQLARQVWSVLSQAGSQVRLLNDPSRVLCRYDLLQKLFDEGINRFKAVRATESIQSLRYPVFVREEYRHTGSLTPLIHSPADLQSRLKSLRLQGFPFRDLLVVEFCNTSDREGVFQKYSAFNVGGEVIPRHVIFSRHWNVKKPDLLDPRLAAIQEEFLNTNPHKSWVKNIFDLSGIDYGRIDYSLLGDSPQIWEINTNPTVRKLTPRLTSAFETIDSPTGSAGTIPLTINQNLTEAIASEERRQRKAYRYRTMVVTLTSSHWLRAFKPGMKSLVRYLCR